jgi:hypothetical protein
MFVFMATNVRLDTDSALDQIGTLPVLCLKTADNKIQIGWVASQSDVLADDWQAIKPDAAGVGFINCAPLSDNACEHGGDHPAPPNARFCSEACAKCDETEHDATKDGCAGICGVGFVS